MAAAAAATTTTSSSNLEESQDHPSNGLQAAPTPTPTPTPSPTTYVVVPNVVAVLKDLGDDTYENWKACMISYLEVQDLWDDVIDDHLDPPPSGNNSDTVAAHHHQSKKEWRKKNAAALLAIQSSCAPEILAMIRDIRSAKVAWDTLAQMKQPQPQPQPQQQQQQQQQQQLPSQQQHMPPDLSLPESQVQPLQFPVNDDDAAVPRLSLFDEDLTRLNCQDWSTQMREYLLNKGVWYHIIEFFTDQQNDDEQIKMDYKTWRDKNAMALGAIHASCAPSIPPQIAGITSAKIAWEILAKLDQLKQRGIPPNDSRYNYPLSEINAGYRSETTNPPTLVYHPHFGRTIFRYEPKDFGPLVLAIKNGDLGATLGFINERDPGILTSIITQDGNTPIHEAAAARQTEIARILVERMSEQDLEIQSSYGLTPLHVAVFMGSTAIARLLVHKNKKLVQIQSLVGAIPVEAASAAGYKDTTRYLYNCTPIELLYPESGSHGFNLLQLCISNRMLDIALDLIRKCPRLSFGHKGLPTSPMNFLAFIPSAFYSGCRLGFWERWIYSCIHIQLPVVPMHPPGVHISQNSLTQGLNRQLPIITIVTQGIKRIYEQKWNHIYAKECIGCICKEISTADFSQSSESTLWLTLVAAVQNGIEEIVIDILNVCPDTIVGLDNEGRDLMMLAIAFRQENIFNLMLSMRRYSKPNNIDYNYNNMLHWAGMPPPAQHLARISGAALQMQRELQWFKAVESIVQPSLWEYMNKNGDTPRQAFTKTHKQLRDDGEKWMKETASSCTVVGALIITIMFAVAFTVPGGNFQDSGLPIFGGKKAFITFIVSDAISLFSSSTSVLMFLGILTSRYAEDDFLKSLPKKLIIGLSTLFMSIAAMMVAFCATITIMLHGRLSVIVPVCLLAGIPVSLFVILQFPLLVEIFISTYFGTFNMRKKPDYKID